MEHTRWDVTTTCWSDKSQQLHRLGDKLLQQVVWHVTALHRFVCTGEFCGNLCLSNVILSLWQVAQILPDLILCNLLQWQNSVAETKILSYTHSLTVHGRCSIFLFVLFLSENTQRVRMSVEWSINPPVFLFSIMCARQTLKRK